MSATQASIGIALIGGVIATALTAILPAPPPIVVSRISYADGMITIDRDIVGDNASVYMTRSAELLDAKGERVLHCAGVADINYPVGHVIRTVPLAQFIGNPACTPESLAPGVYTPSVIFIRGDRQVEARGESFRISE